MPHVFFAETEGAKFLIGLAQVQFEGFIREAGRLAAESVLPPPLDAPPDMAVLQAMAKRHRFEILGPPAPPPGH